MSADPVPITRHPHERMSRQISYELHYGKSEKEHDPIDLYVGNEDSVVWFCRDHKFRVLTVYPQTLKAPARLFYRRFPEDNLDFAYHVNSGPPRPGTGDEFLYKPIFQFEDGTILDPHIRTHK